MNADDLCADALTYGEVMDYGDLQPICTLSKPYVEFCETDEHDRV